MILTLQTQYSDDIWLIQTQFIDDIALQTQFSDGMTLQTHCTVMIWTHHTQNSDDIDTLHT